MRPAERGFLLLSSCLGDPARKPLTTAQLRTLADRSWQLDASDSDRELCTEDLIALGYSRDMARRILFLLSQEDVLDHYLARGRRAGCVPLTRVSQSYPLRIRKCLGLDSPGVLWAKGDISLLDGPAVAVVGSRDLEWQNRLFAREAGRQAALQGFTLVSGNARGSDKEAQESCLKAGGRVICVVADDLCRHACRDNVLYLSEEDFDQGFSAQRALSRNRCVHALGSHTLVAQCSLESGGTWDGSVRNLRYGWSGLSCFDDGTQASQRLKCMGAGLISMEDLSDLPRLCTGNMSLFDQ